MEEQRAGCGGNYFLPSKLHLNIGVDQVSVLSNKGLLDISHDAGVHFRKALCTVDLHIKPCPLPLCWDALWEKEVPTKQTLTQNSFRDMVELLSSLTNSGVCSKNCLVHYFIQQFIIIIF